MKLDYYLTQRFLKDKYFAFALSFQNFTNLDVKQTLIKQHMILTTSSL